MRIMYINNNGGGFADFINVEEGMTIEALQAKDAARRIARLPYSR